MAINSNSVLGDKDPVRSRCSSKTSNLSSCRLIKMNFAGKDSCSSSRAHGPNSNRDMKSPYFTNDKIHLLSRVADKKVINKKPTDFISSFPLAANLYKANSDEFKLRKRDKHKVKKSVLTLPNEPVPMPMAYTVSDVNDSEYLNAANNNTRINKAKKRRSVKRIKKPHMKDPAMEFCDRDARYCSQLNIDLDCSSSEVVNFTGDGERISKLSYKSNNSVKAGSYPHDVWAVLRNINKFQFRPSPPTSQQSVVPLRKRRPINRKSNNSNDTHFIETCRTEEFSYISSFEVDSKANESCSPSSSFDRITVIDKQSEQDEIVKQFSRNIFGSNVKFGEKIKSNINSQLRGKNKRRLKNSSMKVSQAKKKISEIPQNNPPNEHLQREGEFVTVENCDNLRLPEIICKTSSIFKTTENCSDDSSIKENDSALCDQTNNFQKVSVEDQKCKNAKYFKSFNTKVNELKPTDDSEKQLKGITKVILNKGREIESSKLTESPRKPRLALTLPNTNIPKLSRLETKRRLANMKFPIVILGKDQITDQGIYVVNVDPPQFDGLDKHIWPYMLEWSEENHIDNLKDIQKKELNKLKNSKFKHQLSHHEDVSTDMNSLSKQNSVLKRVECKKKKNNTSVNNQEKFATEVSSHVQKSKPLFQLKNKMLHFLQKSPTSPKLSEHYLSNDRKINSSLKDKQVGTSETEQHYNLPINKCSLISVHLKETPDKPSNNRTIVPKSYSALRHPWAKGKWASDFIENIIKKIRTGVYYTVDRKENRLRIGASEVSTQTEINTSKNVCCQNSVDFDFAPTPTLKKDDPLKNIPDFDKTFTTLEIETISTNKIAVKHCVTNVVVHFDIQVLGEASNLTNTKKSMSCIPIRVEDTQEKVFKCNTSIINAILPAELCSIIPTMMRNILDAENKLFLQPTMDNVQMKSPAVLEFKGPESPKIIMNLALPECAISDDIRPPLYGRFLNTHACPKYIKTHFLQSMVHVGSDNDIFPRFNAQMLCHYLTPPFLLDVSVNTYNMVYKKSPQENNKRINYCMALQLYEPKQFSIIPYIRFNITDFINQILNKLKEIDLNRKIKITYKDFARYNINIILRSPVLLPQSKNQNILPLPLSDNTVGIISLFDAFKKSNSEAIVQTLTVKTDINETKEKPHLVSDESKTVLRKKGQPIKVVRKKSYVKFYRKCNSMSSISNYKCTPLNKVTNLEEFCQVLGSNLFCNVLDGCLEKRILGAVEEMKNWITDISPKQALLVLLLINKKETPNLMRFRPVLLQGIAVNRITKADELDTEIEVVERENFKLSQYEGISYLPASSENQDALLEELYWIAKTTASDYQKTFDESSEKLLKSLLEKRKKLNPSYLRVMARYVGLGLLAPTKL